MNEDFDPEQHQVSYSLDVTHETHISDDAPLSFIEVWLALEWSPAEEGAAFERPFDLSIKVTGTFEWPESRDVEYRRDWTEYNGVYLVWPYVRSFVATITGFSPLPPFTLATLAVPRPEPWAETDEHDALGQPGSAPPAG